MIIARTVVRASMSTHVSYLNLEAQKSKKHCHPAAERNKDPILQTLKLYINPSKTSSLLEVSSGSGQHIAHIAPHFPKVIFQPTEYEKSSLESIRLYIADNNLNNVKPPQALDVREPAIKWLGGSILKDSIDYVLNINLIHISEWACAEGLFNGVSYILKPGGLLFTYGPYAVNGLVTPESNVKFDQSLRNQNSEWGLRDIYTQLTPMATKVGLQLKKLHDLPANNKLLVWEKTIN